MAVHLKSVEGGPPTYLEGAVGVLHPSRRRFIALLKLKVSSVAKGDDNAVSLVPHLPERAALTNADLSPFNNASEVSLTTQADGMEDFFFSTGPLTRRSLDEIIRTGRIRGAYRVADGDQDEAFNIDIRPSGDHPSGISASFGSCWSALHLQS